MDAIQLKEGPARWDEISLGEVMLRFDPDGRPHPHHAAFPGVGRRRRIQRGARPAPLLRPAHRHRDGAGRQSGWPARRGHDSAGRRRSGAAALGSLRRRWTHAAQRAQLHRARLWRARGVRLLRSRPHGHRPQPARRLGLGTESSGPENGARWFHTGGIFAALSETTPGGRVRSDGCGAQAWHADFLRPELSRVAVEEHRRQGARAGGQSRAGAQGRCPARQRRRLLGDAGHCAQGRFRASSTNCRSRATRPCCATWRRRIQT